MLVLRKKTLLFLFNYAMDVIFKYNVNLYYFKPILPTRYSRGKHKDHVVFQITIINRKDMWDI